MITNSIAIAIAIAIAITIKNTNTTFPRNRIYPHIQIINGKLAADSTGKCELEICSPKILLSTIPAESKRAIVHTITV